MDKYEEAFRQAFEETIKKLGMEAFRACSWFPSSRK